MCKPGPQVGITHVGYRASLEIMDMAAQQTAPYDAETDDCPAAHTLQHAYDQAPKAPWSSEVVDFCRYVLAVRVHANRADSRPSGTSLKGAAH